MLVLQRKENKIQVVYLEVQEYFTSKGTETFHFWNRLVMQSVNTVILKGVGKRKVRKIRSMNMMNAYSVNRTRKLYFEGMLARKFSPST